MSLTENQLYEFGEFRLDANRRLLSRAGEPLRLNSKAFETLLVLVRNRGRVMTKDELMKTLWPDTFVEEVNLAQNISALRKVLGESPGENRFIATVPGKGYHFVCDVSETADSPKQASRDLEPATIPDPAEELRPAGKTAALSAPRRLTWVWMGIALVLAISIAAAGYFLKARTVPDRGGHSLAILPFQPLSGTDDPDHLGLGMADALITKLSNLRQLPVRPTDVAIRYADPKQDPLEAARAMAWTRYLRERYRRPPTGCA